MTLPSATSIYAQRRARVAAQLGKDGIAIVPTAPERPRNRDSDFLFRHDSYFYSLTGFAEPQAWLVITGDGRSTLFCQPKDLEREIWDGYRLGPDAAPAALGVDAALPVGELDTHLPRLLENRDVVWYPFAIHPGLEARVGGWLNPVRARLTELLKQAQFSPLKMEEQVVVIYAGVNGYLDKFEVAQVRKFENGLLSLLRNEKTILEDIRKTNDLTADTEKKLKAAVDGYAKTFA